MVRIREGDEGPSTNIGIPLTAGEKQSIKPGPMNWGQLMLKIKAISELSRQTITSFLPITIAVGYDETEGLVALAESINADIRRWIDGYEERNSPRVAFLGFQYHWKILRTFVPLQLRLAVEQALWSKGGDYRTLITGFRPIE